MAAVVLSALLIASCGPKPEFQQGAEVPPVEVVPYSAPSQLTARPFHQRINLSWKTNRPDSIPLKGYNIYVSDAAVIGEVLESELRSTLKAVNEQPYPGDTNPATDFETFALENLTNGEEYFIFVTTVFADSTESEPSNQVSCIPRPEGTFMLRGSFSGSSSGFSFHRLRSVPTDDLDNDLYLATINDELYLASPWRLDIVLRETKFYRLGIFTDLDKVAIPEVKNPGAALLQVVSGEVFILEDAEGCFALAKADQVDRKSGMVRISFIYQPKPRTFRF